MKQIVKNKNNQKTEAGAVICDQYCEDTKAKSHKDVTLTQRQTHGLTRNPTFLRDIAQMKAAYLHLRRFKTGARLQILNDWEIVTDAHGVVLTPAEMQEIAEVVYRIAGPGTLGKFNVHVKKTADRTGIVPGPDGNYSVCAVRRLGPNLYRRRDSEKSEYRMLKVANEVVRLKLQQQENVYFPNTDAQREAERKKAKKLLHSEELACAEWDRCQKLPREKDGSYAVRFDDSLSLLKNTETARQALQLRGYVFTAREFPGVSVDDSNPFANQFFMVTHPEWAVRRVKNAKKPIPVKSPPPACSVDLIVYLAEARQLVRQYRRQHLADLAKAKAPLPQAVEPVAIPATVKTAVLTVEPQMPAQVSPPAETPGVQKTTDPAPVLDVPTSKVSAQIEPAAYKPGQPGKPGFDPDNFLVPVELVKAVEALDRPLMRDGQDACVLLQAIGWPVATVPHQPNELILNHDSQIVRLPLDETTFVIQLALLRGKLCRRFDWEKACECVTGVERLSNSKTKLNKYLDPYHPSLLSFERKLNYVLFDYKMFNFHKYIDLTLGPIYTIAQISKILCEYSACDKHDQEMGLLLGATLYRTGPCGFLSLITQVRQQVLGADQAMPPFVSQVPPPGMTYPPLTAEIAIPCIVNDGSPCYHCIKDFNDLSKRLAAGGFTLKQLEGDTIEITAANFEPLVLEKSGFIAATQRRILRQILANSADPTHPVPEPLDLEYQNQGKYTEKYALWNIPLFGQFWEKAEKICANPKFARSCMSVISISVNIYDHDQRLKNMQWWLEDDQISSFEEFVFLQAHCGSRLLVGSWMLDDKLKASPDFKPEELGFTLTEAGKAAQREREAKQALLREQQHPARHR